MHGRILIVALLVFINLFLLFRLIWSDQGVFAYLELKSRYELLQTRIDAVDGKSLDLSQEIRRLKSDTTYQEKIIRERMNFVKKDEILYIFPDETANQPGERTDVQEN
ncbi:MAG: septum formation initiator family protein [Pseudodesulfovibrio sp.]|uniref:Septum formation initiator n=1 Tax=Pseudodesulfovibrio aespoeensis (strain ATCC 700646 / DSM 10631 / Aspo-2) TaxID=643562 RepID=E6VZ65_PSEA9|nr:MULTISPECIES: septum formation initiator family protein [Pseudodesulfovibrio]MBU4192617.1 septum formation initiator family protein [Pseudomonadota bacterium]ADU62841.1 Septum formation initiator [Pseudodesulfovibrio aespoeensis Aspo-2]MBU4380148.1 septum formation initiator family protein [Pseudomonadota bacterium]MBU4474588.1 septum formation initiator family protein [Pseudomonadota bacterium]MBU4514939.1 septum formation initiator family protein [Pseudomonadota bacterium]